MDISYVFRLEYRDALLTSLKKYGGNALAQNRPTNYYAQLGLVDKEFVDCITFDHIVIHNYKLVMFQTVPFKLHFHMDLYPK